MVYSPASDCYHEDFYHHKNKKIETSIVGMRAVFMTGSVNLAGDYNHEDKELRNREGRIVEKERIVLS